jgi:hypothetical protein
LGIIIKNQTTDYCPNNLFYYTEKGMITPGQAFSISLTVPNWLRNMPALPENRKKQGIEEKFLNPLPSEYLV